MGRGIVGTLSLLSLLACGEEDVLVSGEPRSLAARVVDVTTGEPLAGVRVSVPGTATEVATDAEGRFALQLTDVEELTLALDGYEEETVLAPALEGDATPVFELFPARSLSEEEMVELGPQGTGEDAPDMGTLLFDGVGSPGSLTVGGAFVLPETIRVGRSFVNGGGCPPVTAVQEISLESYVKGAVTAEIGVFRHTAGGGDDVAREAYKTLAVAARSYAIYFYLLNPNCNFTANINGRAVRYHINDTACHQRYDDPRHAPISAAVEATRGEILVNADMRGIDKYEYAASCGRMGTRPEHRTALVSDRPGERACVGSWCGHDNCAGHEGCVVRGICQWGSLERSKRGDTYRQILSHYQPELVRWTPGDVEPPPSANIRVDNGGSRFRAPASWGTSSFAAGKIGADYRYRSPESVSEPAEYKVNVQSAGRYEVFTRVPGNGYNTSAPFVIHHRGGRTVVHRNISDRGGSWVSLGTYDFAAKDDWIVQVSCWTTGTGFVIADAIELRPR